ncbi:surface-adhesin E family protein [Polynucleobacter sp. AP-Reno-20A-A9]|uniref:surface-adhesin E family protein n=1 Tax=Polynucleobacter sp. AP-Reno-20A-A9 TaxID=2576925 RepID=UPI001C0C4FC7|nr:surface-adhesin E family protein [Polynucleobacter sp. AP-Reno-20A-A9]MBU3628918.1 hypothetical protein [Polynucleobacter sp. AP-Reno-20A-A9]
MKKHGINNTVRKLNAFRWLLVVGILYLCALRVQAEQWDVVAISETNATFYYDPATVIKDSYRFTYWQLANYANPIAFGDEMIFSSKTQLLVDCKSHTYHMVYIFDYSKPFAAGHLVHVDLTGNTPVYSASTGSIDAIVEGQICKN